MQDLTFHIRHYDQLASTQKTLSELISQAELPQGTLVITDYQQAGIGQEGNHWESMPGKNLTFSFLLRPSFLEPAKQFMLHKMVSLAMLHCLVQIPGMRSNLSVKWPNDIYAGNNKLGGILISNAIMGSSIEHSIIGIGLNVNQNKFTSYCPNPTSIIMETGLEQDKESVLKLLLASLSEFYGLLNRMPALLDARYLESLYRFGEWKEYEILGKAVKGRICGTDEYGKLLLDIKGQGITACDLKEIIFC